MLETAEAAARDAAKALRERGISDPSEAHLLQQLLEPSVAGKAIPPPLASGAARIVAVRFHANQDAGKGSSPSQTRTGCLPIWPEEQGAQNLSDEEALDRWGFRDTR